MKKISQKTLLYNNIYNTKNTLKIRRKAKNNKKMKFQYKMTKIIKKITNNNKLKTILKIYFYKIKMKTKIILMKFSAS